MAAPTDISLLVADWVVAKIATGVADGVFSTANVARMNSVKVLRELLSENEIKVYVIPIDIEPNALRGEDYSDETTRVLVFVGKRIKNPSDNGESDPVINQVGAILRWFVNHPDHLVETGTRRLNRESTELISTCDDDLLNNKLIAVGGFVLAFDEDYTPPEEDP